MTFRSTYLIAILTMPLLAVSASAQQGPPPTPIRADAVRLETVQEHRQVTGELRAVARAQVATKEEGLVIELLVSEGQAVARGEVLAKLDRRNLQLERDRLEAEKLVAEATVIEREAQLALDLNDLDAVKRLDAQGASNARELADAQATARISEARLLAAQQSLKVIEAQMRLFDRRLEDMIITAPFPGVVTSKLTELGQWVQRGDALVEVVETDVYDAWLDVPQRFAEVALAQRVPMDLVIEAVGRTYRQVTPRVVPLIDPTARSFPVAARIPNDDGVLAPGMSVVAFVPLNTRSERLTVSKNAVMRNATGAYVLAIRAQGNDQPPIAVPTSIQPLFEIAGRVVIERGPLSAGDLVVSEGNERLFPGSPVQVIDTKSTDDEAGSGVNPSRASSDENAANSGQGG